MYRLCASCTTINNAKILEITTISKAPHNSANDARPLITTVQVSITKETHPVQGSPDSKHFYCISPRDDDPRGIRTHA